MPQNSFPNRKTVQSNPTPVLLDLLFWEKVNNHGNATDRIEPGTPHPDRSKFPGCIHVADVPVPGSDDMVIRYWSSQYQNQDTHNWSQQYQSESASHPTWARRYLVRNDQYVVLAYQSAFTGVFLIKVTNEGQDYATDPVVTISGGGGSGATAKAIRTGDNKIGWIRIVTEGTGYTGTPTVTISGGGGTGATAQAIMQGNAKLIHQEQQALPQDNPLYSTFHTVLRVWETLPGPELVGKLLNTETGVLDDVYEQVDVYGTNPFNGAGTTASSSSPIDSNRTRKKWVVAGTGPSIDLGNLQNVTGWRTHMDKDTLADFYKITGLAVKGATLPPIETNGLSTTFTFEGQTLYLVDRSKSPKNNAQDEWTLIGVIFPEPYVEYPSVAIRFPGLFQFLNQFSVPFSFPYRPPFPGIHYNYLPPRTNARPARATYYFTDGLPATIPDQFVVLSPGTESKMVPIREDTIHPAIEWFISESGDDGSLTVTQVENIPASSPETYDPNDIYAFKVQVERWYGNIFKVTLIEASEGKGITYFPPVNRGTGLTIGAYGGGLPTADYSTTGFYAVNTEAGPFGVQLFGLRGPTWTRIQGTTGTDAAPVNLGVGVLNTIEYITGDGLTHSEGVQVYTYGNPGSATIEFTSNPANNDQIKLGFLNGDATHNQTYTLKTTLSENALATGTLTLSGNAGNNQTVTISRGSDVFVYTWKTILGEFATSNINLAVGNVVNGETLTLGSYIYTFTSPFVNSPFNIAIAATGALTLLNIIAAIMRDPGEGTLYGTGTLANDMATIVSSGSGTADLTAIEEGVAGNDIPCSSTSLNMGIVPFSGGVSEPAFCVLIGGSASASIDNLIAAINLTGTAGTEYTAGTTINTLVSAAAGVGDTMVATSLTGGVIANTIATTETMTSGSWVSGTLSGAGNSVAYEVQRGSTAAESAYNLQLALNASGTAGTNYSTGTLVNPIITVPTEVEDDTFTVSTIVGVDWESLGSWQTGGNFEWITDANGAFPVNDFGTVSALTGATNGSLIGTLEEANHSLVMNFQDFDDSKLKERNFPPTPDDLVSKVIEVGNRDAQIWFGHFGSMPLKYQKSVDGLTNWIDGAVDLNAANVYPPPGTIRKVGITDFADAEPYRFIRFVLSPATAVAASQDYGIGKVSRLFLSVVWSIQ